MPEGYFTPIKKKKPNQGFFTKTNSISPPTIIPGSPQLPGVGAQLIPGTPEILPPEGQGGWFEPIGTTPAAEVAKADPEAIVFPFESKMGQSLHAGEYYNPDDAYLDAYIEAKDKVDFDWSTWDEIVFGSNDIDPRTGKRIGGGIVGMLWEDVVAKPAKLTRTDPLTATELAGDFVPGPMKIAGRGANMVRELWDPKSESNAQLKGALGKLGNQKDKTFLGYGSKESLGAVRDIARLTLGRLMGPEAGTQISKGHATLLEGIARGTTDLGILGQMIGASTEAGDVGRAQLEVDKHLNIMAKRHWAKRGGKYDKTVNWLYGKPDLVGIPEEVIQSWEEDAKPKFDKLKAAKRAKWRVLNILMTERERARTGKETQIGSWMKANGDKKGAAKFEKKVVSAFAEQSSYFADPGSAAGALASMGSKVVAQTAGKGFLRRTTQKGMEGAGDYIAGAGVAVREASTSVSQKAEQAVAKLVDDPDAAKLATQALPGRVGTLARVGELTGTAIETAGQVISSTGRIIGDGPGQRGFLGRIGQDKSVRLRHLIGVGEPLDGIIDLGVNTMKAGGTGAAVGGGLGALTGEEEFAIAGAATGGFLGVGQSVPMHMFGVHQKAKQANDVKAWIEAKPEETRALLGKLDFEQQLSMANVESLVKGVSDQAGAGDVDVRYVHGDDAEAIRHERGAWIGEKGELVVNLNHPESAGHTLAHEAMHALEDLPHEGMQERIAALNAKLFDTLDIDGNLLTKGLYSLDDEVSFVNQYQNLLNHETIPHWRIDMGLEGTGRITKEQYLKSQELRSSMQKEVRAESFASMARSSDIGAVAGVKQRFMDHIMLAENTSKLARLRDVLMGEGVKFESDGAPSALFVKKTVLRKPSKPGGKGVVEYKPITNNKEVNALLRDFVRVRRKIRQELAPEPGEEAGSSYTMKQLSEPGNERIAHYFRDNDTFAKDNEGNVLMAGGKPVRLSQREINKLQKKRSNAMLTALDNVDSEGGLRRFELKNGKYEWVGHHMNDAQLAAMMALPNDVFAPSLKEKLRRINYQMQREGATLLIDYNAALKGGKYSSAISSAWRHDSPFGMKLTAARNLTITGFNIDRVLGKMNQWRGDKKGRFLDLWGGDYNAFKQSMHQYMDNHMNNRPGHTDLDADATTAIHKKDRINELFDVPDSEARRDLTLGVGRRPRLISSRRFDRINQVRDGEGNWHTDYGKIKENRMPAGKKPTTPKGDEGAQYMPAAGGAKVARVTGKDTAVLDKDFSAQFMPSPVAPNAVLKDFHKKKVQILTTDLSVAADKAVDGVVIKFAGGPGHLGWHDGWGFTNEGSAKGFGTRWKREGDPLIGLTSMTPNNHLNQPLAREYYTAKWREGIENGLVSERKVNKHVREVMDRLVKSEASGAGALPDKIKAQLAKVKTFKQFSKIFHDEKVIPWTHASKIYKKLKQKTLPISHDEMVRLGVDLESIAHATRQPEYHEAPTGSLLAIAEYDGTAPAFRPDLNKAYPWFVPLKEKAFLKQFHDVRKLSTDKDLLTPKGKANTGTMMGKGIILDKLAKGDVQYMPAGKSGGEVFYSNSAKALESPKVPKAGNGPAMLNAMIKGGANLQEMKWMDLDRFLMDHKGKVTKEQVQDFINTNQIQVVEKVRSGKGGLEAEEIQYLENKLVDLNDELTGLKNYDDSRSRQQVEEVEAEIFNAEAESSRAKSGGETLHGGGDLVLPGAKKGSYRELELMLPRNKGDKFIGPEAHWGKDENVFASVRFNERTDADGKRMLFIEEVQSDWAAKGRDEGFKGAESVSEVQKLAHADREKFYRGKGKKMSDSEWNALVDKIRDWDAREVAAGYGMPKAPFVSRRKGGKLVEDDKWRAVAFKRILRWASDEGFSRVGWINGTDTAKRYNLSKKLDSVEWQRMPGEDTVHITALDKEGKAVISDKPVNINKLKNTVGRELSEKILASDKISGEFTGLELEVGGEGHKQFYDVDLPNYVRKYVKKWGGEVGEVGIDVGDFRVFRDSHKTDPYRLAKRHSPDIISRHPTAEAAWVAAEKLGGTTAHYTDITPSMKKSVVEGQSLFMPAGKKAVKDIETLLDKYDEGGHGIDSVEDVSVNLRDIIAEENIFELDDAISALNRAIDDDWDSAGRGGEKEAGEQKFLDTLDAFVEKNKRLERDLKKLKRN